MTITLTLTDEQLAALMRSNAAQNSDESTRPKIEDFIGQQCAAKFNEHVAVWQGRDADALATKVRASLGSLAPEDIAQINAIIDAKTAQPAPVDPVGDTPAAQRTEVVAK